jgi:hypothetical protein
VQTGNQTNTPDGKQSAKSESQPAKQQAGRQAGSQGKGPHLLQMTLDEMAAPYNVRPHVLQTS